MDTTFQLFKVDKHGRSMYRQNGSPDTTIRIGASMFAGVPPPTIEFDAEGRVEGKTPKVKLTKEERAALPKKTLAEKAAEAAKRAAAAKAKADKLAAQVAAAA